MKLSNIRFYGGAQAKVARLGLAHIFLELLDVLVSTEVRVQNRKHANGAGEIRKKLDARLAALDDWQKASSGDIDWIKKIRFNKSILSRLGVEIQVSGRSDLLARDIVHIRNKLQDSHIDVGVIVVPSDNLAYRLTDRVASWSYAVRYVQEELPEAQRFPIILLGIEHDDLSDKPLPKMRTNRGNSPGT